VTVDASETFRTLIAVIVAFTGVGGLGGVAFAWFRQVTIAQQMSLSQATGLDQTVHTLMDRIDQLTEDSDERARACAKEIAELKVQHTEEIAGLKDQHRRDRDADRFRIRELEDETADLRRRIRDLGGTL
jgi:vacuolar-type H+-ATPase subunit I/STV1